MLHAIFLGEKILNALFTVIINTCPIHLIPNVKNTLGAWIITLIKRKIHVEATYNGFL